MKLMRRLGLTICALFMSTAALADCPDGTTELYYGDAIGVRCVEVERAIFWNSVGRICLTDKGHTIHYKIDEEEKEELVGFCQATLDLRYFSK